MSGSPPVKQVHGWAAEADAVSQRIGCHSVRSEPRRRAIGYLQVLLNDTEQKNRWQIAVSLGEAPPLMAYNTCSLRPTGPQCGPR
ncbi:Transposase OS=Corynebacterium casei UCMA 3821 GN=CCAS_03485 PE=4 SV=1 [Tuwongella immobilis]|uniref:Transposase n=1 Tax=Tuwongella immobilis TaxID=692036 RepID=A0A6C2YRC7_9BACT|nr:Transposase OS=Corynebacterium casei UCMA 3821 GN=CCAS_03485 PE=4 SV=1 [Tuwongella immobilis]VTS04806.1 Transposase OS=Corynebacterium casei UCMA 3821 GN=CCAS_03485 PE=4 SV=1 [Tuwongella immobilis]